MTETIQTIGKGYMGNFDIITKSGRDSAGVEYVETWDVYKNGKKTLRSIEYTKGERKAFVEFSHCQMPWGRTNAYMTPITPAGRQRGYKSRDNARAKAYEFVCGK